MMLLMRDLCKLFWINVYGVEKKTTNVYVEIALWTPCKICQH